MTGMRSVMTGFIGFGKLVVPVRMYNASQDQKTTFNQFHGEDQGRIAYKKTCVKCGKEVRAEEIVKGIEFDANTVVTISKAELDALKPEESKALTLELFCQRSEIPDALLGKPFFVGTASKKEKLGGYTAFTLLHDAMIKSGRVAVVSWTARENKHIGLMYPLGRGFGISEMLYSEEARSIEDVEVEPANVDANAIALGMKLIEKMTAKFDHSQYVNTYGTELRALLESKLTGVMPAAPADVAPVQTGGDLEALLKESIA